MRLYLQDYELEKSSSFLGNTNLGDILIMLICPYALYTRLHLNIKLVSFLFLTCYLFSVQICSLLK